MLSEAIGPHVSTSLPIPVEESRVERPSLNDVWQRCQDFVEPLLQGASPNILLIEQSIRSMMERMGFGCGGLQQGIDELMHRFCSTDSLKSDWKAQKKWVKLGFDSAMVDFDPLAVRFAVETGLAVAVAMYKDASSSLEGDPMGFKLNGKQLMFLVEGSWTSVEEISKKIPYSKEEKRFIGWNIVHPLGFVPVGNINYQRLYPIAKLRPEIYTQLAHEASAFWKRREEVDEGQEKPYILQVLTTGRPWFPDRPWWGANLDDHSPEHSSARLIAPNGDVYSFGTKMFVSDAEHITQIANIMTTADTRVATPDYEEPKSSHEKRITSIPMTKERFDAICDYVSEATKGFPFNFAKANCARFVCSVMSIAGVSVDIKMTVGEFLAGCTPNLADIPVVGKPLAHVSLRVASVAGPILDLIRAFLRYVLPRFVHRFCATIVRAVHECGRLIGAFIAHLIAITFFGAARSLVSEEKTYASNRGPTAETALPTATRLLGWKDLFHPGALMFYHALKLRRWQEAQASTTIYTDARTGLACLKPKAPRPGRLDRLVQSL